MPLTKCNNLKNVLIVRTDRIGDVVMTTPVIKALRKAFPLAKITMLVSPVTVDLIKGNPYLDDIIVDDRKQTHKGVLGFLRLAREIYLRKFDAAFVLHTKRRTNMACFLAGIPMRVGYRNDKNGFLLTHPIKDVRHHGLKHETQLCLDVLRAVGIETKEVDVFIPAQKEADAWALEWINEHAINPGGIIAIHPGASDVTRCWPAASFSKLIERLMTRYSVKVVLIGGKEQTELAEEIIRSSPSGVLNLTGQVTLAQTISILRRCRLMISNNSGPMLMGWGVGINVIALFLHTKKGVNPERWGPLAPRGFCLVNKPGEEIVFDAKGHVLSGKFDSISVDEVTDLVEQIFALDNQSLFCW